MSEFDSSNSIKINLFDINGEYQENAVVDMAKNILLLDCPNRILDQFIKENSINDLKKKNDDRFIVQYNFNYEISPNVQTSFECDIINNFSVSHHGTLDSKGYIVFCNLENENIFDLLEKMIDYIRENCSITVKTYVIGVFKETIDEKRTYSNMQSFLASLDFEYDYYEMFLGDKDVFPIISKEFENSDIMNNVFESIFKDIFYKGKVPKIIQNKKVKKNKLGSEDKSNVKCLLF